MMHKQLSSDLVIQLHDIARTIEQQIGIGQLSDDVRNVADRLHTLTTETGTQQKVKE
jgi:hypothetical protein